MMRTALIFIAVLGLSTSVQATSYQRVFLACVIDGSETAQIGPCRTTLGKPISLAVILEETTPSGRQFFGEVSSLRIGGAVKKVRPPADESEWMISWYKVEPIMYHVDGKGHDPDNPDFLWYTNAGMPGGKTDRKPLPPDTITYHQTELKQDTGLFVIEADAHPTDPRYDKHDGLGTMRYTVVAQKKDGSKRLSAPTLARYEPTSGIRDDVARIEIRADDSYLGYLTGYFNVPGVFGPYDPEIERHLGIDCSHFVVGAWREYSRKNIPFTNVTGLRTTHVQRGYLSEVTEDLWLDSTGHFYKSYDRAQRRLQEPIQIKPEKGDLILFNYSTDPKRRQWDHIGVFYDVSSENTLVLHTGPAEPGIDPLAGPMFADPAQPTRVAILRWNTAAKQ